MATASGHRDKAKHNDGLRQQLAGSPYLDWEITTAFYVAVHEVEAFLLDRGIATAQDHGDRDTKLKPWPRILAPYRDLKALSNTARYQCGVPTEQVRDEAAFSLETVLKRIQATV